MRAVEWFPISSFLYFIVFTFFCNENIFTHAWCNKKKKRKKEVVLPISVSKLVQQLGTLRGN